MAFIPQANIGLVVLTNRLISTGFSYGVRYHLVDMLYGLAFEKEGIFATNWENFLTAIAKLRAPLVPTVDPTAVAPYLGQYTGSWRVELREGNTLWAVRGPYEWRLLKDEKEGEFMVNNGFGIATPLKFAPDDSGIMTMSFTLTSGEKGEYQLIAPGE
jgi:hypothetical protein